MELREFRPSNYSDSLLREILGKSFETLKSYERERYLNSIEGTIQCAIEDYLRIVVNNAAVKAKLKAPMTKKDLSARMATALRVLSELKDWKTEFVIEAVEKSPHYEKGDEECPFFSEAILYNLLGKEDARTLLSMMRTMAEGLGALDRSEVGF